MQIELSNKTNTVVDEMIFSLLDIFKKIGLPCDGTDRRLERMAKAVMAVGGINTSFNEAKSIQDGRILKTRDIIEFENENYNEKISSGSYDDVRRKDLLYPVQSRIVVSSSTQKQQSKNNPSRGYGLSLEFTNLLHSFGTAGWEK